MPGFTNDNRLAVFDLARHEVQACRGFIDDHREAGNAGRSLNPSRLTLDRLKRNARAIQFLANVADDFKPAQLERSECYLNCSTAAPPPELSQLPVGPDKMTGVTGGVALEIVLMLGLSLPKIARLGNFGHHFTRP